MADISWQDREEAQLGDFVALLKPRVMSLVVFTALVGMLVAPVSTHPVVMFASLLCIALGGGASGALNMWWDRDIDRIMRRTSNRPIPAGLVSAENALIFGLWLAVFSVAMLGLFANIAAAALLAFTIFFYVVIYSIWLKRRTPQNIVIGGAAGAFPPMIGWLVATGDLSLAPFLMFGLIFMWTPPHFWALALFVRDDYTRAGVPMLTVTNGPESTRRHILVYTLLLAVLALAIAPSSIGGPIYLVVALILNMMFIVGAVRLYRRDSKASNDDAFAAERAFFRLSLFYLFAHFLALLGDAILRKAGIIALEWPVWY